MRVVLDTNVLVSGLVFKGRLAQLFPLIEHEVVTPCFTTATAREFREVFRRTKFRDAIRALGSTPEIMVDAVLDRSALYPDVTIPPTTSDPLDDRILACALAAKADCIVSGDAHVRKLKVFHGIPILAPREFFTRVKSTTAKRAPLRDGGKDS